MTPRELIEALGDIPNDGNAVGWLADQLVRIFEAKSAVKPGRDASTCAAYERLTEIAYELMAEADLHEL